MEPKEEMEVSVLDNTLRVINSLEADGIIGRYAIGGAIGLVYYTEPAMTYDLDVFCYLPQDGALIDMGPLYSHLLELGYESKEEHVIIEGIPVQFLPPTTNLVEEALENAIEINVEGVATRILSYEHLLAIMVETGRPKDRARIVLALASREPDERVLEDILGRHELLEKWGRMIS